jgi:magnesium transporter
LADRIIDDYSTVLNEIEESIASLEEEVEENPSKEMLHRMDDLRRDLIAIRRSVWPTLTFVRDALRGMYLLVSDQNSVYFRDLRDHLTRLIDQIEAYHGRVKSVGQLYWHQSPHQPTRS